MTASRSLSFELANGQYLEEPLQLGPPVSLAVKHGDANKDDLTVEWATQPKRKWPKTATSMVKSYMLENEYFNVTAATGKHEAALEKQLLEALGFYRTDDEKETIAAALKKKLIAKVQNTRLQLMRDHVIAVVGDKTHVLQGATREERLMHKADLWIDSIVEDVPFEVFVTAMCRRITRADLVELITLVKVVKALRQQGQTELATDALSL